MTEDNDKQNVFIENEEEAEETTTTDDNPITSTGLKQNLAGFLCYLVGFITGIIFLLIEKENKFVRYHAMQSIVVFGGLFILGFVLTAIPLIGWALGLLISPLTLILWIFMMWKAYQNKMFRLPLVSNMTDNFLNK